jgi:NitT/TauT family transport system permease protein
MESLQVMPHGQTQNGDPVSRFSKLLGNVASGIDRIWRPAILLAVCGGLWWLISATKTVKPYLVPSPAATFQVITDQWSYLAHNAWVTTYETILGFTVAVAVGVVAAVVIVCSATAEKTLYPLLLFAQVVPKIAVAPLFVVWLGFGLAPKVLIAVLIAFFPVVISMTAGLKSVDPEILELAAIMGAPTWKTFARVRFPASLPYLFGGLKVAVTLAVTGAVVGEFVGANEGLGFVILQANGNLDTPTLFAGLLVLTLLGVALFVLVELAEYWALPWHASRRGRAAADPTL